MLLNLCQFLDEIHKIELVSKKTVSSIVHWCQKWDGSSHLEKAEHLNREINQTVAGRRKQRTTLARPHGVPSRTPALHLRLASPEEDDQPSGEHSEPEVSTDWKSITGKRQLFRLSDSTECCAQFSTSHCCC
ncbi:hypothetical protein MHYP_G00205520 [Metynnis hypsauchen]